MTTVTSSAASRKGHASWSARRLVEKQAHPAVALEVVADEIETKSLRTGEDADQKEPTRQIRQIGEIYIIGKRHFGAAAQQAPPIGQHARQIGRKVGRDSKGGMGLHRSLNRHRLGSAYFARAALPDLDLDQALLRPDDRGWPGQLRTCRCRSSSR